MLYAERDDFKDLTPIEQDEGPSPLAPINYSQKCEFVYLSSDHLTISQIKTLWTCLEQW